MWYLISRIFSIVFLGLLFCSSLFAIVPNPSAQPKQTPGPKVCSFLSWHQGQLRSLLWQFSLYGISSVSPIYHWRSTWGKCHQFLSGKNAGLIKGLLTTIVPSKGFPLQYDLLALPSNFSNSSAGICSHGFLGGWFRHTKKWMQHSAHLRWRLEFKVGDYPHMIMISDNLSTLPETNIFAPENGWLEYDRFLSEWPIFRWELLVLGSCNCHFLLLMFPSFPTILDEFPMYFMQAAEITWGLGGSCCHVLLRGLLVCTLDTFVETWPFFFPKSYSYKCSSLLLVFPCWQQYSSHLGTLKKHVDVCCLHQETMDFWSRDKKQRETAD